MVDMSGFEEIDQPWISWFLSLRGSEFFCKVPTDYILDRFNLTGLTDGNIPYFEQGRHMVLDFDSQELDSDYDVEEGPSQYDLETAAETVYGLIHARFILTQRGQAKMLEKYRTGDFGICRRALCNNHPVLPIGLSDELGKEMVKVYCPKCRDVYKPYSSRFNHIDGAYFGTSFPHMLFMVFPEFVPKTDKKEFHGSLYGFKIHPRGIERQREKSKPITFREKLCEID